MTGVVSSTSARDRAALEREVTLLDVLDRLLGGGVVLHGEITLAVADVDLVHISLRALVASVETARRDLGGPLTPRA